MIDRDDLTPEELDALLIEADDSVLGEGHSQADLEHRAKSGLDTFPATDV